MERMVFFNIAWMKDYRGVTLNDEPVHGGKFIKDSKYGGEVYNFQPYKGKMYGFVEAGWKPEPRCINITRLGASKRGRSVPGVLVVWVARCCHKPLTVVVGWYKDATVYRKRQPAPAGSNRKRPNREAPYFVEADERNCCLIPPDSRDFPIPRGGEGELGQKNIWYADSDIGTKIKTEVLEYIRNWQTRRCR